MEQLKYDGNNERMACRFCYFFMMRRNGDGGDCRFHAPRPDGEGSMAIWPEVMSEDWCGSYLRANEAELMNRDRARNAD